MRRFVAALFLPLLGAGCGSGAASRIEEVPQHLRQVTRVIPAAPDRHPYADVSKVQGGQWVKYREGDRTFTLAAVGREGDSVWIELIEEGDPREASARLVAPGGAVKKALFRELSKDGPSQVVDQPLEQSPPVPPRAPEGAREEGAEKVAVGGRELAAKRIRIRSEDLEGRIVEETSWWHPDVPPLYAAGPEGGLVRRVTSRAKIELLDFGTDARPLVAPSK